MPLNKAVFLDRDGTINESVEFLKRPEQFQFLPNAKKALRLLSQSDYTLIVISNQPIVARGLITLKKFQELQNSIESIYLKNNVRIDASFYCFHHETHGVGKYKKDCECRKPKPGLLLQAAKQFNIDLSCSWMVGDRRGDIACGKAAGTKTILVKTGDGGLGGDHPQVKPDYVARDLLDAVNRILGAKAL